MTEPEALAAFTSAIERDGYAHAVLNVGYLGTNQTLATSVARLRSELLNVEHLLDELCLLHDLAR